MGSYQQCFPGLQGWPIQINGYAAALSSGSLESLTSPNDIKFQFAQTNTPWSFNDGNGFFNDIQGTHTFFMNGIQFTISHIRICKPLQQGLTLQSNPVAEYIIWARANDQVRNPFTLACIVIPLFLRGESNTAGKTILSMRNNEQANLSKSIPTGTDVQIVRYSTCVEQTRGASINIHVAYFSTGAFISQNESRTILSRILDNGVPNSLYPDYLTASYTINDNGDKVNRQRNVVNGCDIPYTNSLSATNSDFIKSFRRITGFSLESAGLVQNTSSYKCVAINRQTDIKNGKLLIDPRTGNRLDEEVSVAENQEKSDLESPPSILPGDIAKWLGIIFGIIVGLAFLATVIYWGQKLFARPKDAGDVIPAVVSKPAVISPP